MKMKMLLLTVAATVIGLLATATTVFGCTALGNQGECPSEFVR